MIKSNKLKSFSVFVVRGTCSHWLTQKTEHKINNSFDTQLSRHGQSGSSRDKVIHLQNLLKTKGSGKKTTSYKHTNQFIKKNLILKRMFLWRWGTVGSIITTMWKKIKYHNCFFFVLEKKKKKWKEEIKTMTSKVNITGNAKEIRVSYTVKDSQYFESFRD